MFLKGQTCLNKWLYRLLGTYQLRDVDFFEGQMMIGTVKSFGLRSSCFIEVGIHPPALHYTAPVEVGFPVPDDEELFVAHSSSTGL
jgi:hypothetical protein